MRKQNIIISSAIIIGIISVIVGIICANLLGGKHSYTISFKINEGVESEIIIDGKTPFELPEEPNVNGYLFDGWYLDENYSDELTTSTKIKDDISVYAKFSVVNYTINYAEIENAINSNPTSYNIESDTIKLKEASKTGYIFDGWYNGTIKVEEIKQGSTGNISLSAHWIKADYSITYNNLLGATNPNQSGFNFDTPNIDLQDLSLTGYIFKGWKDGQGNFVKSILQGTTNNVELTAIWELETYTITYKNELGLENPEVTSYTVESQYVTLASFNNENYRLLGWYDEKGNLVDSISPLRMENITLTAKLIEAAKINKIQYTDISHDINESQTFSVETFNATCFNEKNEYYDITCTVNGEIVAGNIISVTLSIEGVDTVTIENIKVYGTPNIQATKTEYLPLRDDITEFFIGTDTFGNELDVTSEIIVGELKYESTVELKISTKDKLGNTNSANYTYMVIYDDIFEVEEGVIKSLNSKGKVLSNIIIPKEIDGIEITSIGGKAFDNCQNMRNITIPDSVETIESYAFYWCSSLQTITIPSSVTTIESYTFHWCENLRNVTILEGVKTIESDAFNYCKNLESVTIPDSVETIESYAFYWCSSLQTITIPSSVTTIGSYAFEYSKYLTIITPLTSKPDGWSSNWNKNIAVYWGMTEDNLYTDGVLMYVIKDGKATVATEIIAQEEIVILSQITIGEISYDVTSIGKYAFYECSATKITIPDSITDIGIYGFNNCDQTLKITIPANVTEIGEYAFSSCDLLIIFTPLTSKPDGWNEDWAGTTPVYWGLTEDNYYTDGILSYVIQDGKAHVVKKINDDTSVEIKSQIIVGGTSYDVISIKESAFYSQNKLLSITIPNGITTIGDFAFYYCESLTTVNIPNGVTTIGNGAFFHCSKLPKIELPNSLKMIGNSAFYECKNLSEIEIPSSVTTIGQSAFYYCYKLPKIVLSTNVTTIGYYAFGYNDYSIIITSLTSKPDGWNSDWNKNIAVYWGTTEDNLYTDGTLMYVIKDGKATVATETISQEEIVIPSQITIGEISYDVTSIGKYAFYLFGELKKITIPNSIVTIEEYAFYDCYQMPSITIPSSVTTMGNYAFSACSCLSIFTQLTSKPDGWSENWARIIPVYWGLTEDNFYTDGILSYVIQDGKALVLRQVESNTTSVTIPSQIVVGEISYDITGIGDYAFYSRWVNSIIIPEGVTRIGKYSFYYTHLSTIVLPDSLTEIGAYAFYKCTILKSIKMSSNLTIIGEHAFDCCSCLQTITIPSSVTIIGEQAFRWCFGLTIYCTLTSAPDTWASNWNVDNYPVVWGESAPEE